MKTFADFYARIDAVAAIVVLEGLRFGAAEAGNGLRGGLLGFDEVSFRLLVLLLFVGGVLRL